MPQLKPRPDQSSSSSPPPPVHEPLWKAADVAAYLQCSQSFVYKAAEDGRLGCLRIGSMMRFDPKTVQAFAVSGGR